MQTLKSITAIKSPSSSPSLSPSPSPSPSPSTTASTSVSASTAMMVSSSPELSLDIFAISGTMDRTTGAGNGGATFERKHQHRMSWATNMRRLNEMMRPTAAAAAAAAATPASSSSTAAAAAASASASASIINAAMPPSSSSSSSQAGVGGALDASTMMIGGGNDNAGSIIMGNMSGRTTSASGRASSGVMTTISGSSHALNDILADYHSSVAAAAAASAATDYHHYPPLMLSPAKSRSCEGVSFNMTNGSIAKLLPPSSAINDGSNNQQTKCSIVRGLVLCICLNLTYANIVRFPRELDKYGSAYLIPYVTLLALVGLPNTLLEISVGQFLGQGSAHTWRASPIFKGACMVSRFASWLSTIWVSLQAVLALAYMTMFAFSTVPFGECIGDIKLALNGYKVMGNSGQECLQRTFLTPFWQNPLYFGLLSIGLICIWIVVMLCTHNGTTLRRSLFFFGLMGFMLLCLITGWEVRNSFERAYFPDLWPFEMELLHGSNIWFSALMQVLFATRCGLGTLPTLASKFLYKGDAVRTSIVYICFNLLVNAIAVTLFMVQFDMAANGATLLDELKPLTAIYDRILYDTPAATAAGPLARTLPALICLLIVIAAFISLIIAIYTSTRVVPHHPNYVVSLVAVVMAIVSLSAPKFAVARLLDARLIGTLVCTALVFDLIAMTWIYGVGNIYTDLEFSIGRPILQGWMAMWLFCPILLTCILVWWCSDNDEYDLLADYLPRWAPILFVLAIIFIIACVQIFHQVDYNFFGMICEAAKSAKEWGPTDPLVRHSWKQWRSVCQDTGRRDFTLRRRGTRDYTHSIKNGGQYSTAAINKYGNCVFAKHNWKTSTPGNNSPNYSGSVFGDSAIEEDISVEKFPDLSQQIVPFQITENKPLRHSQQRLSMHQQHQQHQHQHQQQQHHSYQQQQSHQQHQSHQHQQHQHQQQQSHHQHHHHQHQHQHQHHRYPNQTQNHSNAPDSRQPMEKHREIVYIRRLSDEVQHATRIEITPSIESITYGSGARNPLAKGQANGGAAYVQRSSSSGALELARNPINNRLAKSSSHATNATTTTTTTATTTNKSINGDHICWRKYSLNCEEHCTEL